MGKGDMTEALPLVSVVMPAYNAEKYIEQAILSVVAQTVPDWELLVLDDGSGDATCAIVERLAARDERITLLKNEENLGVAKTRNRGIALCRGRYIAFLDSDDVWHADKLEKQLACMEAAGADIGYCSYSLIDAHNAKVRADYLVPEQVRYEQLLKENVIGCSTVMLAPSIAKECRFRTDFYHEDYVLWLQLLKEGHVAAGCAEVLVDWRYLQNSRSFDKRKSAKNRWEIYRKCLQLPFMKSAYLMCHYAAAGLAKYRK